MKEGRILIEPTAWRTVLCNGYDPEKTAQHLRKEGLLLADPGKLQKQEKILRAGSVVENARFYVLDMQILNDPAITEEPVVMTEAAISPAEPNVVPFFSSPGGTVTEIAWSECRELVELLGRHRFRTEFQRA